MTRVDRLKVVFMDEMPEVLEDGVLYISQECHVALHNCACGCGKEVSTPLVPTEFTLSIRDGRPSLWPSIGNHDFACASHYIVRDGRIVWAGRMSRSDIEFGRWKDQRLKRPPIPVPAPVQAPPPVVTSPVGPVAGLIERICNWIKLIWK
ncbi:DUF6527 family protein [Sphingomonas sp. NFR04]|uniref:DUF6527 family protein n=1 Tax=Sphingomonas sp. NFR04 TaxID=1566283 RepID=UPI0034A54056